MEKRCNKCDTIKDISQFTKAGLDSNNVQLFRPKCKNCRNIERRKPPKNKSKRYLEYKIYYEKNKAQINEKAKKRHQIKYQKKSPRVIKRKISTIKNSIISILFENKLSKTVLSLLKKLPYTKEQLKLNIESKFEPWMNWNNFGSYLKSKWKNDDPSTWTWTIQFLYELPLSLNIQIPSEEFGKCISFENMKPISSLEILKEKRKKNYEKTKNDPIVIEKRKEYIAKNKDKIAAKNYIKYRKNRDENLKYHKNYRAKNKEKITKDKNKYYKRKIKTDVNYKLRRTLSSSIYIALKRNNSTKNNLSILKFLPYTMEELKQHLEKQFEPWMNWNNWTVYNPKTWNDNDLSTWTWQIDHIIPHCNLKYTTMNEENFFKCWALENLRPYSSKLNIIEQDRK